VSFTSLLVPYILGLLSLAVVRSHSGRKPKNVYLT
jgi:hypothetical protein